MHLLKKGEVFRISGPQRLSAKYFVEFHPHGRQKIIPSNIIDRLHGNPLQFVSCQTVWEQKIQSQPDTFLTIEVKSAELHVVGGSFKYWLKPHGVCLARVFGRP